VVSSRKVDLGGTDGTLVLAGAKVKKAQLFSKLLEKIRKMVLFLKMDNYNNLKFFLYNIV